MATPALARGGFGGGRVGFAPGLHVTAHIRPGLNPAVRVGFGDRRFGGPGFRGNPRAFGFGTRGRPGRFGYGFGDDGYGGYGLDAVGLGLDQANGFPFPAYGGGYGGYGDGGGYYPPQVIPAALPPCPHPLIISIGRGLRHAVKSHVVYGSRPACGG